MNRRNLWRGFVLLAMGVGAHAAWGWQLAEGPLKTRWTKDVSPEKALPEYPRPQMMRKDWTNLNGLWQYAIRPAAEDQPKKWDGEILVPFAVESSLSGIKKAVKPDERLWYRRTISIPQLGKDQRMLLHFGAVDWKCTVWVNGKQVGEHAGGYDPFTFDITDALKRAGQAVPADQVQSKRQAQPDLRSMDEIVVAVTDPTDTGTQPRGKQVLKPHGIWYTAVTGIWQTVWLEPLPVRHIQSLKITPDVDAERVTIALNTSSAGTARVRVFDREERGVTEFVVHGKTPFFEMGVPGVKLKLWSPENPFLYEVEVDLLDGKQVVDRVTSYVGMRKIEVKKDAAGVNRLWLNNKVLFQFGPLDQGWWPDGLYTAPTDEALKYDIEMTKRLGMNMARKHVKVEPDRWYYWCDKLGLLVWQDMPSGDKFIRPTDPDIKRSAESAAQYEREWAAIIQSRFNHPSIVVWVPFNEGWGQFDTARIVDFTRRRDPSRLVDAASGWADRSVGDVCDMHKYPGPGMPKPEEKRAAVLGEFGGLGMPVRGHTWQQEKNWGYVSYDNAEKLTDAYVGLLTAMRPLIGRGLSAAVYTQTTDVEGEVNGLMTYDREIVKTDSARIQAAAEKLYSPPQ